MAHAPYAGSHFSPRAGLIEKVRKNVRGQAGAQRQAWPAARTMGHIDPHHFLPEGVDSATMGSGVFRAAKLENNTVAIVFDILPDHVIIAHFDTPILMLYPDGLAQVIHYHNSITTHRRYNHYAPWRAYSSKGEGFFYASSCFSIPARNGILLGWDYSEVREEAVYTRLGDPAARKAFVAWMREQPWMNHETIAAIEEAPKRGWGYGSIALRAAGPSGTWLTNYETGELVRPVTLADERCLRIPTERDVEVYVGRHHYLTVDGAEYGARTYRKNPRPRHGARKK